ncbi:MAG: hypothetical protein RLY57_196 [Candidatus Parcubacteria bacterium]|jgi:hypothetical protein
MKTFCLLLCGLLAAISAAFGAEPQTTILNDTKTTFMVSVASSEPPPAESINIKKPEWFTLTTSENDHGRQIVQFTAISGMNNVWYPLEHRTGDGLCIGGFGDQHEIFMRFPTPIEDFTKATLRLFVRKGDQPLPKRIEVRKVTTSDPLPITKTTNESWVPERIRYSMRPSSEYFTTIEAKEGWVEIDITLLVKDWMKNPASNHGIHLVSNEHRDQWAHFNGPRSKENQPQLVVK